MVDAVHRGADEKCFFRDYEQRHPADTVATHWTNPIPLREVTEGEPAPLLYWHATEYMRINTKEYLAAFNDNDISIQINGIIRPQILRRTAYCCTAPRSPESRSREITTPSGG